MKKLLTIIGARPQIIKASAISRAIHNKFSHVLRESILHTGQHYDENMSDVFFREMGIPKPEFNLGVGSGSHGKQTASILEKTEKVLLQGRFDGMIVYGDTNSTLAAALAAAKLQVPIFHVEAGLRSFNMEMPEEVNRLLTDHISRILFCPTPIAVQNLQTEGFNTLVEAYPKRKRDVFLSGDIMYDNALHFEKLSPSLNEVIPSLQKNNYLLVTIHRNNNTDQRDRLNSIISSLLNIKDHHHLPIVFPIHPRTANVLEAQLDPSLYNQLRLDNDFHLIPPAGYLDMITLLANSRMVLTDSGGLQKESFFFKKPCLIFRPESEWVEIISNGNAILADADPLRILSGASTLLSNNSFTFPPFYGDGNASEFILEKIVQCLNRP